MIHFLADSRNSTSAIDTYKDCKFSLTLVFRRIANCRRRLFRYSNLAVETKGIKLMSILMPGLVLDITVSKLL